MRKAHCDCCGTGTDACALDVLRASGWCLVEHSEGEQLVLLCPVCAWQRSQAAEVVTAAVESANAPMPISETRGRRGGRRGGWFWS
jgi:hypothetical protein